MQKLASGAEKVGVEEQVGVIWSLSILDGQPGSLGELLLMIDLCLSPLIDQVAAPRTLARILVAKSVVDLALFCCLASYRFLSRKYCSEIEHGLLCDPSLSKMLY